jgi:hypothetical protein
MKLLLLVFRPSCKAQLIPAEDSGQCMHWTLTIGQAVIVNRPLIMILLLLQLVV